MSHHGCAVPSHTVSQFKAEHLTWLLLLACLASASAQESQSSSYLDGRLLVLDHFYSDGSHQDQYILQTGASGMLPLGSSDLLSGFQTNDLLRVWVTENDSTPSSEADTDSGHRHRALHAGADPHAFDVKYSVTAVQCLTGSAGTVVNTASPQPAPTQQIYDEQGSPVSGSTDVSQDSTDDISDNVWQSQGAEVASSQAEEVSSSTPPPPAPPPPSVSLPYTRTTKVVSDMSMLVYIVDLCGKGGGPATTAQEWKDKMLSTGYLGGYVANCSGGVGYIAAQNSLAIDVKLGCSGRLLSDGSAWTATSCSGDNMMRLAYAADEYAVSLSINPRRYRHHVLILPRFPGRWMGSTCGWAGTAVVGFAGPAWTYMWLSGEVWNYPQLYLHEIGHNYMLGHSSLLKGPATVPIPTNEPSSNVVEHGDWSSAMGFCCQMRCFHAAHAWQMGWSQALAAVDQNQLTPGVTLRYFLPSQMTQRRSFVTVTTNWMAGAGLRPAPPLLPPPGLANTFERPAPAGDAQPAGRAPAPRSSSLPPPPPARPAEPAAQPDADTVIMNSQITEDVVAQARFAQPAAADESADTPAVAALAPTCGLDPQPDTAVGRRLAQTVQRVSVNQTVYPQSHTFWLSWRPSTQPYDMPPVGYRDGLLIHLYDGTSQSDAQETFLQALLQPGADNSTWTDITYGSGLVVRLINQNDTGATITVCRKSPRGEDTYERCNDGLDNDCNGLTDAEDPACARWRPPSPPAPPPAPRGVSAPGRNSSGEGAAGLSLPSAPPGMPEGPPQPPSLPPPPDPPQPREPLPPLRRRYRDRLVPL